MRRLRTYTHEIYLVVTVTRAQRQLRLRTTVRPYGISC